MTSIAEARNCSSKSEDSDVLNSDYIVTESIEYTVEDESHNVSFISALDKSELDIELEICEEILALDDNDSTSSNSNEQPFEYIDLEDFFDSPESVFESHPGACIERSYQQASQNITVECAINVYESAYKSKGETCDNRAKDKRFENYSKPLVCEGHKKSDCNLQDLPSNSNVSENEFDSEVKKCWDILKYEEPSDTDASDHFSQIPKPAQLNNNTTDSLGILTEKEIKSEKIEPSIPAEKIIKSEKKTTDASVHLGQIPQPAQYNDTADSLNNLTAKEIKSEKIESSIPAEIILKSENITTDASVHIDQIPLPAQYNDTTDSLNILPEKEIKSENKESLVSVECDIKLEDIPLPISEGTVEEKYKKRNFEKSSDSDSISIVYESSKIKSKKIKSEIVVRNLNLEVKSEKDEDVLSLYAETDISTAEEEYEVVESPDSPQIFKESSDTEQDDVGTRRVSPRSVVVVPQTNYVHGEHTGFSDVVQPETDYLDAERDDINDSGWESIRTLATEEERYKMVRKIWESNKVPDPNRNLTYHSYRKRHLKNSSAPPIARKRKATSSLDVTHINPSKRQRSCTFLYDLNIDSLSAEKQKKEAVINNQMQSEFNQLNNIYFQQEQRLQREYYGRRNNNTCRQIYNLRHKCRQEMENIKQQYTSMSKQCSYELDSGIHKLNKARNEVLQFFKFYKGLNPEDPTVLTAAQLQESEDIENIYSQFDKLYKR